MQALTMLDRLVEEDRRIEQKYNLPFRSPRQVATSFQPCAHCHRDIAWLIFGDFAKDAAGLEAYARLMASEIKQKNLITYIIAPPSDPGDLDGPALLLKVHPIQEEPSFTTPDQWEQLIARVSDEHCQQPLTTLALHDTLKIGNANVLLGEQAAMVQAHERQPKIEIDDLQPDWSIKSFKATWQEGTLTAYAYLDPIDDQPERGYVLNCTYSHKQPGRRLSDRQIDAGATLTSRVRDFMLEQMVRAGWVRIGMEKKGRPIWQHSSRVTTTEAASEQDQVKQPAPAAITNDQAVITMDDLTIPPKKPGEWPRSYEAHAVLDDVQAIITVRHYNDPQYPGGYILDARTDRANPLALGTMGRKQEQRAQALLPGLREQVEAALVAAHWVKRWQSPQGADLWLYEGSQDQSQKQDSVTGHKKTVEVKKTSSRARTPYTREVSTKVVTFSCSRCQKQVTVEKYPGKIFYCEDCAPVVKKEKTRARVARLRTGRKKMKS
jgi:hypothetical protein